MTPELLHDDDDGDDNDDNDDNDDIDDDDDADDDDAGAADLETPALWHQKEVRDIAR